jgi:valyl-tRNA synthetase
MDLIDEFGADALRFTLAFLSVPGRDIRFGRDHVKVSRNFITKIWNAARFLQYKEVPFDKSMKDLKITKMLNKWLVLKLKSFKEEITCNMAEYRFDYASHNIQFFIRDIFCDFFVEAVKISDDDEIKAIAGCVFIEFLRVAHPFIPFVTDYLANVLKGAETLMLPAEDDFLEDIVRDDESVKKVDEFVELIHQARSQKQLTGEKSDEYINIVSKLEGFDDEIKLFSKLVTG